MGGPRIKIDIGAPVHTHAFGIGELPVEERPVTVKRGGETFSARCYLKVVNGKVVYSIGQCAQEAFDAIVHAFDHVGERELVGYLL